MANRDNDDGKNGRQNKQFNIDSNAFDDDFSIDDDYDFSIDDDMFINPSQKKKQGDSHYHDMICQIIIFDNREIQAQKFGQHAGSRTYWFSSKCGSRS